MLNDAATRTWASEDETKFNAIHADIEDINKHIERREKMDAINASLVPSTSPLTLGAIVSPASCGLILITGRGSSAIQRMWSVDIRAIGPSYQPTMRYAGLGLVNRVYRALKEYF